MDDDDVRISLLIYRKKSQKPEISCALNFHLIHQTTKGGFFLSSKRLKFKIGKSGLLIGNIIYS